MIGQTISHYRILEKLGGGGMGVVYRAEDTRLGRHVALKFLPEEFSKDASALERFQREARAASALNHSNICTIHDIGQHEGRHFMVMELLEGRTLKHVVEGKAVPRDQLLEWAIQICDALDAAHAKGILHRDIKPANIFITQRDQAKVLDFGLAKQVAGTSGATDAPGPSGQTLTADEHLTSPGAAVGTVAYMSPEQVRGSELDRRSDLFSFGIVLYEMATGRQAFAGNTSGVIFDGILNRTPAPANRLNPALPLKLEEIINKLLEKDREVRYQSAAELRADLKRLKRDTESGRSATQQASAGEARPRWRVPLWAIGAGVVALAVLVSAGILWQQRNAPSAPAASATKLSVAVLPLKNMSADPENEYFSDGITEEIISKLSRIQNLGVASRTSVSRFKNTQKDIKDIGRELSVRYVLEGSVRRAGNRVRIAVQLADASTGFQLWSDDFEGDLKDVFGLQEQTALKIAEALNLRLTPKEQQAVQQRSTQNPEAYDAFLRGRALVEFFDSPKKLDEARSNFEKALKYDPDYALALAGLSVVEAQYYRNLDPSEARQQRAEELARRALSLDPQLAEAHTAMGRTYANRFDYVRAAAEFREATRLEPDNTYAWDLLSWALAYQQPPDGVGAEKAGKEAVRLSPASFGAYYHLGRAFLVQKRYKEAAEAFRQAKALNPAFSTADFGLAQVFVAEGNYEQARKLLEQLVEVRRSPAILYQLSITYTGLHEKEKALRTLENALQTGYRDFAAIDSQPQLETLRSDPRFQQLLKRYRK